MSELVKSFYVPYTDDNGITHFVDIKTENQQEVIDWIYYDGHNDEEVSMLCARWVYDLCSTNKRFINLINGEDTLFIEPSDTMRCQGLNIPVGSIVYKMKAHNDKILRVEKLTHNEQAFVKELENIVISHLSSYQIAELRMDIYKDDYYFNFYLKDLSDAPYEWHGGSTDYRVDKNKSFTDNLLVIKESIEKNGVELEW